jgi:hypothetical protein
MRKKVKKQQKHEHNDLAKNQVSSQSASNQGKINDLASLEM